MTYIKATEENLDVMRNILKLAPSLIMISEQILEEIDANNDIIQELVNQSLANKDQLEYLVMENERLSDENEKLKIVH
jgi:3-phosphoglycerate kinase